MRLNWLVAGSPVFVPPAPESNGAQPVGRRSEPYENIWQRTQWELAFWVTAFDAGFARLRWLGRRLNAQEMVQLYRFRRRDGRHRAKPPECPAEFQERPGRCQECGSKRG